MEIIIRGTQGEIAALIGAIQGRQKIDFDSLAAGMLIRPEVSPATHDKGEEADSCKSD